MIQPNSISPEPVPACMSRRSAGRKPQSPAAPSEACYHPVCGGVMSMMGPHRCGRRTHRGPDNASNISMKLLIILTLNGYSSRMPPNLSYNAIQNFKSILGRSKVEISNYNHSFKGHCYMWPVCWEHVLKDEQGKLRQFSTDPISHPVVTSQSWGQFSSRSLHTSALMSSMVPKQNGTGQWTVRSMNISPSWKLVRHGNSCTVFQYYKIFSVWNLPLHLQSWLQAAYRVSVCQW